MRAQQIAKCAPLSRVGQFAVNDEVGGLDEFALLGELLNRVTTVAQDSRISVNVSNLTLARTGVAVALVETDVARLGPQSPHIHCFLSFGAFNKRQFIDFVFKVEQGCLRHKCGE